jgi:hypothetical protein
MANNRNREQVRMSQIPWGGKHSSYGNDSTFLFKLAGQQFVHAPKQRLR